MKKKKNQEKVAGYTNWKNMTFKVPSTTIRLKFTENVSSIGSALCVLGDTCDTS